MVRMARNAVIDGTLLPVATPYTIVPLSSAVPFELRFSLAGFSRCCCRLAASI